MTQEFTNSTELKEIVGQTKEAKSNAFKTALSPDISDETAEKVLLYAKSLAFSEAYLQIALIRKLRMENHDETRN